MSDEIDEIIKTNLRKYKPPDFTNISIEDLQYAAGLSDTDGCFQIKKSVPEFYIAQAEKGINALYFMYEKFGGKIILHKKGNDKHQTSYDWKLYNEHAIEYAKIIIPYLLIKKREALVFIKFHTGAIVNTHIASNINTNEIKKFDSFKDCADHFKLKQKLKVNEKKIINNWEIKKEYTNDEIKTILQKRIDIDAQLKKYHITPHDLIPEDIKPSIPWIAGVCDGECTFDTNGKSAMHVSITQKYRPLLDLFKRLYGGSVWHRTGSDTYGWQVHTEAKQLIQDIYPYIRGKKKQVELLINMKPGEAPEIHVKLRELKGNHTYKTPRIDALKEGAHGIRATVTKPHTDPKKMPTGVFRYNNDDTIFTQIQYNKKVYKLGVFDSDQVDEAHELYLKYKKAISEEKKGGPKS